MPPLSKCFKEALKRLRPEKRAAKRNSFSHRVFSLPNS